MQPSEPLRGSDTDVVLPLCRCTLLPGPMSLLICCGRIAVWHSELLTTDLVAVACVADVPDEKQRE
jgi:hypothetical protein